jgi:hypothetical protein
MCKECTPEDHRNLALAPMLVELLKAPENLPDFALPGCVWVLACANASRPAVALKMLEHDVLSVLMSVLRRSSPAELVATAGFARRGHGQVLHVLRDVIEPAQIGGRDLTAQLLSSGLIDVVISGLSAVAKVEEVGEVNADVVFFGLWFLKLIDGAALGQIEDKLRAAKPALRYLVDSTIVEVAQFGFTCAMFSKILAAIATGGTVIYTPDIIFHY